MACFLVSAAEAVVVKAVEKGVETKESSSRTVGARAKVPLAVKLRWLSRLLCGGSLLLAFEHLWHGEIVPWFPFLTAMSSPEDTSAMLREMATVGVGMAVLITAVWACMCAAADAIVRRAEVAGRSA